MSFNLVLRRFRRRLTVWIVLLDCSRESWVLRVVFIDFRALMAERRVRELGPGLKVQMFSAPAIIKVDRHGALID